MNHPRNRTVSQVYYYQLETYGFTCEGGPLELCTDWQALKDAALAACGTPQQEQALREICTRIEAKHPEGVETHRELSAHRNRLITAIYAIAETALMEVQNPPAGDSRTPPEAPAPTQTGETTPAFTPGPWTSVHDTACHRVLAIDGPIAIVSAQFEAEREWANAHLIAAAPAMYAALKLAQLWLANSVPTVELDGPMPLPEIAAVLAKAEGSA